jgi:adenine specific DNA methylase Mod
VDRITIRPNTLKEMEQQVIQINQNMKISHDRQKIYANRKITPREFNIGDHAYIRVRPRKSSLRMGACAKMETQYYVPLKYYIEWDL